MAKWLRRLTHKPKVRTAVGSSHALDSLVAVCNSSPGRPEPCEGNLVAAAGSCGGLMVKHPWPLLEISVSDFRRLATLNINTYLLFSPSPVYSVLASTNNKIAKALEHCMVMPRNVTRSPVIQLILNRNLSTNFLCAAFLFYRNFFCP